MYYEKIVDLIIPSKQVRDYLKEIEYKICDFDLAALIWNSSLSYFDRLKLLQELSENTEDKKIKS